ncbi:MAG: hypothetical protein JO336_15835 [Acidobacteriia bacterium]|nr:hypothetical protein [Terriglobia bacterium]MBV8902861.1 hypothetical protein [Terriglobia bacterium]MBV9742630.1 hypothetical protein [Terriglobia bacterium]
MKRQIVEFLIREHRRRSQNFDQAWASLRVPPPKFEAGDRIRIHKRNTRAKLPKLSIVLLDWSCRERFDPLNWLEQQDVPRDSYELIWVELFGRVIPEAMEHADVVVTCHQSEPYHKHEGYNIGLLLASGELLCVCDSDAVFPPEFVRSICGHFYGEGPGDQSSAPRGSVLFHFEGRSSLSYPGLRTANELKNGNWHWSGLHPNVGACMTVRTANAYRFGGFDEDPVYAGYLCGPYELGWRLLNAGLAEVWHDPATMLWHFAHPDPVGDNGILPSLRQIREMVYPHVDLHALHAVESLTCGRLLPLKENTAIFRHRLSSRAFGTEFVARYAFHGAPGGFPPKVVRQMRWTNRWEAVRIYVSRLAVQTIEGVARVLRPPLVPFVRERRAWKPPLTVYQIAGWVIHTQSGRLFALPHYVDRNAPEAVKQGIPGKDFWSLRNALLAQRPAWCSPPEIIDKHYQGTGWQTIAFLNLAMAIPSGRRFDLMQELVGPAVGYWGSTVSSIREMILKDEAPTPLDIRKKLFLEAIDGLVADNAVTSMANPILVGTLFDTNLVYFKGKLLALPHVLGFVDLHNPESSGRAGIRLLCSCAEVTALVDSQLQAVEMLQATQPE